MQDRNQRRDEDLINSIRQGDVRAKEELVRKYTPMVKHIARNYYSRFLDFDDLMQEGMIGLLSAIDKYRPDAFSTKFSSFAYLCIVRKIYNVIKYSSGNKQKLLNNAVSLYDYVNSEETRSVVELIPSDDVCAPEELVAEKLCAQRLEEVLSNHLSLLEYAVVIMLLRGYSSSEIQSLIGVNGKAVDNARTRVRTKLRRLVERYGSLTSPRVPDSARKRRDLYAEVDLQACL